MPCRHFVPIGLAGLGPLGPAAVAAGAGPGAAACGRWGALLPRDPRRGRGLPLPRGHGRAAALLDTVFRFYFIFFKLK